MGTALDNLLNRPPSQLDNLLAEDSLKKISNLDRLILQKPPVPSDIDEKAASFERKRWEQQHPFEMERFLKGKEEQLIQLYLLDHPKDQELMERHEKGEFPKLRMAVSDFLPVAKTYREMVLNKAKEWNYSNLEEQGLVAPRRKYKGFFDELSYAVGRFGETTMGGALRFAGQVLDNIGWLYGPDTKQLNILEKSGKQLDKFADKYYELARKNAPAAGGGFSGMVTNAVANAAGYMTTLLALKGAGSPTLMNAFGLAFINEGYQSYDLAKSQGATEEEAQLERMVVSTLIGSIESLQLGGIIKFSEGTGKVGMQGLLQAAKTGTFSKIKQAGTELTLASLDQFMGQGLEEAIEQAGTEYVTIIHGEVPETRQAIFNIGTAFLAGGIASGIISLPTATVRAIRNGSPSAYRQAVQIAQNADDRRIIQLTSKLLSTYDPQAKATREQSKAAHALADQLGMSDKNYKQLAKKITGQESTTKMTQLEAYNFIAGMHYPLLLKQGQFNNDEIKYINDNLVETPSKLKTISFFVDYIGGEMPQEIQLRKELFDNLKLLIDAEKKERLQEAGKKVGIDWSHFLSARYVMLNKELKTKIPFSNRYRDFVENKRMSNYVAEKNMVDAFKKIGKTPFQMLVGKDDNDLIINYLMAQEDIDKAFYFNRLSKTGQLLADTLESRLAIGGDIATKESVLRWIAWKHLKQKIPADLKELQKSDEKRFNEIVKAYTGADKLGYDALIKVAEQYPIGLRKNYYMTFSDMENVLNNLIPSPEIQLKQPKTLPSQPLPKEAFAGKGKPIEGSVVAAIIRHESKIDMAIMSAANMKKFWNDFTLTNPSKSEIKQMDSYFKSLLGRNEIAYFEKLVGQPINLFWKLYFFNPVRGTFFATRNLLQNIALAPSQINIIELIKSIPNIIRIQDKERIEDFETNWNRKTSERYSIAKNLFLREVTTTTNKRLEQAAYLMDKMGDVPLLSDSANRASLWHLFYDATKRNVNLYRSEQISLKELISRINLYSLHPVQRLELLGLLNKNKTRDFINKIAEYKVENVHFKYETEQRAEIEQTIAGRAIAGLYTFPRGVYENLYYSAVKPLIDGWHLRNTSMMKVGTTNLIKFVIGHWLADQLLYRITGKHGYSLLSTFAGYSLLAPGVGFISELMNEVSQNLYQYENDKISFWQFLDKSTKLGVDKLLTTISCIDILINLHESWNDYRGVTAYRMLKKYYFDWFTDRYGKPFDYEDRTMYEKFAHVLFGGFEREYAKPEPEMAEEK